MCRSLSGTSVKSPPRFGLEARSLAAINLDPTDVISHEESGILQRQIESRASLQGRKAHQQVRRSMATKGKAGSKPDTRANLGFEAKLWQMADGLRNNMDAADYKHVMRGLMFLKYISDVLPKLISGELHLEATNN